MKATLLSSDGVLGTLISAPAINLSNGLRVANFSSPHPFNFVDGSVLPACDEERSKVLSMDRKDVETPWAGPLHLVRGGIVAVKPVFITTYVVMKALSDLQESWDVDLIMVPFPLLQALSANGHLDAAKDGWPAFTKVGTVIMADRITKQAAIDKFGR
jgi:hypothetical protein